MKVLIDTNIIIDVIGKRQPHYESSAAFLKLCPAQVTGFVAASQTTDIFYLFRKEGLDAETAKKIIQKLIDNLKVLDVTSADVSNALASEMSDYEDSLLAFGGKRHKAKYIITRNEKDFKMSPVPAISPQKFLNLFFPIY